MACRLRQKDGGSAGIKEFVAVLMKRPQVEASTLAKEEAELPGKISRTPAINPFL